MIPLLLCLLAAPPELPPAADYSPRDVGRWCRDAGLQPGERFLVESLAFDWQDAHDAWTEAQESAVVDAMEATWALPPGSEEREQAAQKVYLLQREIVERQRAFVQRVKLLIRLRGRWPTELASSFRSPRTSYFAAGRIPSGFR